MKTSEKALFPALHEEDIEVKVGKIIEREGKKYVELILYKNNIVDSMMLDTAFGPLKWKKENVVHFRNDGTEKMTCIISVKDDDGNWISKDGVGTESDFESEKGQETDAMKRAGFNWGIGRELKYKMPKLYIDENKCNILEIDDPVTQSKVSVCRDCFSVEQIIYTDEDLINRRISYIAIRNDTKGEVVLVWDARNKTVAKAQKAQAIREEKSVNTDSTEKKATTPTSNKDAVCRPTFTAVPTQAEESTTTAPSEEATTTAPTLAEATPVEVAATEPESVVEEANEEVTKSTEFPLVEAESSEPKPAIEVPAEETPETFDIADPYMEPCDVAKFKREGKLLGELKPSEIRWVFQRPDASARLKEACRMIAKDKVEVKAEFISHGINP